MSRFCARWSEPVPLPMVVPVAAKARYLSNSAPEWGGAEIEAGETGSIEKRSIKQEREREREEKRKRKGTSIVVRLRVREVALLQRFIEEPVWHAATALAADYITAHRVYVEDTCGDGC